MGEDIPLLAHRHMSINLCSRNAAVPEEGLDIPQIHIGLQELGGEGVPEHMGRHMGMVFNPGEVLANHGSH